MWIAIPPRRSRLRGVFAHNSEYRRTSRCFLFLSRLIPRKGADILIDAFARVCPRSGFLAIAGPNGDAAYVTGLKKQVADLGLSSRGLFTGPLYDAAKAAALQDATVFALPSRYENFGNVSAEAMVHSVPVIISDGMRHSLPGRASRRSRHSAGA